MGLDLDSALTSPYMYIRGFTKFLCRRSVGVFSRAVLAFLMKESKKRRQKQPGKLMAKSHSQLVNLPGARPLMNPRVHHTQGMKRDLSRYAVILTLH